MAKKELFKFDKKDIERYFIRDLNIMTRIQKSFKYLANKLGIQKVSSLENAKWYEGKSYNWCVITKGNVTLLIRKYGCHFTIYTELKIVEKFKTISYKEYKYGIFTYSTNRDMLSDKNSDARIDNPFMDIDESLNQLFEIIEKQKLFIIWNNHSFTRPKHIEVEIVMNDRDINSYDLLIYACEEISLLERNFFAENEMLEKIKTFEIGKVLPNGYIILDIITDLNNDYYHNVGLKIKNTFAEEKFLDVYSLTEWYYNDIFSDEEVIDDEL